MVLVAKALEHSRCYRDSSRPSHPSAGRAAVRGLLRLQRKKLPPPLLPAPPSPLPLLPPSSIPPPLQYHSKARPMPESVARLFCTREEERKREGFNWPAGGEKEETAKACWKDKRGRAMVGAGGRVRTIVLGGGARAQKEALPQTREEKREERIRPP